MACILVVDDERPLRLVIRRLLETRGHRVVEAENGREALKLCHDETPDLVVTDVVMPEFDGLELVLALHKARPQIPLVAMSGAEYRGLLNQLTAAKSLGAVAILQKPFSVNEFMAVVEPLLAETAHRSS
jgi:CheY-like chemotaxis protein